MQRIPLNPDTHQPEPLPEYLGLGSLEADSVDISLDQLQATYTVDGDRLYQVSVQAQRCQIVEYLDGESLVTTTYPGSLQRTFFQHLLSQLPYQSRRFERLYHRLHDGRNVFVRFAAEPRFFYYPAGYLFTLRQPIVSGNQALFDEMARAPDAGQDSSGLRLVREGVVLKLLQTGEVIVETVRVADFSATLHRVAEATDRLWQSGIVPKEKEYQLAVLDSSLHAAGNLSVRLGDLARGIAAFAIVVTEGTDWTMEKLQNDFGAGACQMLEELKQ